MHHFFNLVSVFPVTYSINFTSDMSNQTSIVATLWNGTSTENLTDLIQNFKHNWPIEEWIEHGFFSEEYIKDINVHWLKYPSPEPIHFYIFGAIYLFIAIVGIVGNILVIYLFIRCKSLRSPGNSLIVNLAISDGFMLLKSPLCVYNCFHRGPALGDVGCRFYGFFGGLTGSVTIITLSLISFDRYYVIKFPLRRSFSNLRTKIFIAITWIYGAIFSAIPSLDVGFGKFTYEGYLTSCGFDYLSDDKKTKDFILIFFFIAWVVPFCIISFSYINIVCVVTRNISKSIGRESFRHIKKEETKKQEIKLALVVFFTILLWFLSWTPYAIVALLGVSNLHDLITPLVSMIPALFCKTSACLNCYVYAFSHPKFQKELKRICCRVTQNKKGNNKIWSSDCRRRRLNFTTTDSIDVDDDTVIEEEEIEEVDNERNAVSFVGKLEKIDEASKKPMKKQSTVLEMISLKSSFKNNPSSSKNLSDEYCLRERIDKGSGGDVALHQ